MSGVENIFLGLPLSVAVTESMVMEWMGKKDNCYSVTFVNPASWALARQQPEYANLLKGMTAVLANSGTVAGLYRALVKMPCPYMGFDRAAFARSFFSNSITKKASLFIIAGQPGADEQITEKLVAHFQGLSITGSTHSFGDFAPKITMVLEKNPDVVIVGMASPRQETFIAALRDAGYKGMIIGCADYLEHFLIAPDYYPAWVEKTHTRLLCRIARSPAKLWQRHLAGYAALFIAATPEAKKALLKQVNT